MGSYQKRKAFRRNTWKTNANIFNDEVLTKSNNDKYVKQDFDTTDEEGLGNTYQAKDGLRISALD